MAVKSQSTTNATSKPYPKIMYSTPSGMIVLFSSEDTGVVIDAEGNKNFPVGHYSDDWNERLFRDYQGSVTLTNE